MPRDHVNGKSTGAAHGLRVPFSRGRYVSASIERLIDMVSREAGLPREAVLGNGQNWKIVNARSVIANLAEEFAPRVSSAVVENTMNRGAGWCSWARDRHNDRIGLSPSYSRLYEQCRAKLVAGGS